MYTMEQPVFHSCHIITRFNDMDDLYTDNRLMEIIARDYQSGFEQLFQPGQRQIHPNLDRFDNLFGTGGCDLIGQG